MTPPLSTCYISIYQHLKIDQLHLLLLSLQPNPKLKWHHYRLAHNPCLELLLQRHLQTLGKVDPQVRSPRYFHLLHLFRESMSTIQTPSLNLLLSPNGQTQRHPLDRTLPPHLVPLLAILKTPLPSLNILEILSISTLVPRERKRKSTTSTEGLTLLWNLHHTRKQWIL